MFWYFRIQTKERDSYPIQYYFKYCLYPSWKNTSSFTNHTNKIFCNYRKSVELSSRWRTLYQDKKKYHEIRGGLTQEPITEDDLRMICPLHALMRGEGIVQKLIFHRDSRQLYGQIRWKSFGEFSKMYHKAKENPCEVIYR